MSAAEQISPTDERGPIPSALKRFIWDIQSMVELADSEREILLIGRDLMARLICEADALPAAFSATPPGAARQFQLYSDAMERFCVVSTILAGGAALSIAQPAAWEIMGVLTGAIDRGGRLLRAGSAETLGSKGGDASRLSNALDDQLSIAIHVYGGAIGGLSRRQLAPDGTSSPPLGYANGENAPPYDIFSIQTNIRD
ncbi:hypothetical protein [Methylocystis iwaonis]|uniref:3-mercaptopropionate dioxygenase n=1 Tax=Methylocystis iwaonis TaxID=2885079 RepID=A0ABM8EBK1_9HYPH|nr:hypothetical protein [Methylocystis iwaonis]BDV35297.1 3-mercaptopropionate dioxygenase [Methylocystis iwaonis]